MNIQAQVLFNADDMPTTTNSVPIPNVPVILQVATVETSTPPITAPGVFALSDSNGNVTFTDVPAGDYQIFLSGTYTGSAPSTVSFSAQNNITATPAPPQLDLVSNPPYGTTNIQVITAGFIFVTVTTSDITGLTFINAPIALIPLKLDSYATVGNNLITAADNGTFGIVPFGTPPNTSPATEPYPGIAPGFGYQQFVSGRPNDGYYSVSNTINLTNFGTWWNITDRVRWNESGRIQLVNGAYPGTSFFSSAIAVKENTDYTFSTWALNLDKQIGSVLPEFSISITNPAGVVIYYENLTDTLPITTIATWKQIGTIFNSGSNTELTVSFISQGGAASGNDFAIDDVTVYELLPAPTLTINKFVSSDVVRPGEELIYTLELINEGTESITDIRITDVLPANVTFVPGTVTLNDVPNINLSIPEGVTIPLLAAQARLLVRFTVVTNRNAIPGSLLINNYTADYSYTSAEGTTVTSTASSLNASTIVIGNTASCTICPTGPTGPVGPTGPTGSGQIPDNMQGRLIGFGIYGFYGEHSTLCNEPICLTLQYISNLSMPNYLNTITLPSNVSCFITWKMTLCLNAGNNQFYTGLALNGGLIYPSLYTIDTYVQKSKVITISGSSPLQTAENISSILSFIYSDDIKNPITIYEVSLSIYIFSK